MTHHLSVFLAVCLLASVSHAQTVVPRNDYGALLEPQDVLMHGAGQSVEDFDDYWRAMPDSRKPGVYMFYTGLNIVGPDWADELKATLLQYPDHFVIPQIGLSMTADGTPGSHYEDRVAAGEFDEQIDHLIEGFRRLGTPAYLRIGYEFNGVAWNGYLPESYKTAFIRITEKLRAADLEVATVWCAAMDGERDFFAYYPGDEWVDWFGLDLFSAEHFSDPDAYVFLDSAHVRQKPVMIGETTPRYVGVTDGEADWNAWFVPFFDYMHARPEVKQFGYINWDWLEWSQRLGINWNDWGEARLQMNQEVLGRYTTTIADPIYQHAEAEATFRQRLGYNDTTPPPVPANARRTGDTATSAIITWDPVSDPSGLARYIIRRDGEVVDYTLNTTFAETNIMVGAAAYTVSSMDRAGNESAVSDAVSMAVLRQERITNGGFEEESTGWQLDFFSNLARATLETTTDVPMDGTASGQVAIQRAPGTDWHIQLRQFMPFTKDNGYLVTLQARANEPVTIPLMFQQNGDPYTIYHREDLELTTEPQVFSFEVIADATHEVAFTFFLGDLGRKTIWLDAISVVEIDASLVGTNVVPERPASGLHVYPHPAMGSSTVSYKLAQPGPVQLAVYDLLGRRVRNLHTGWQTSGRHELSAGFAGLTPGLYVVHLVTNTHAAGPYPVVLVK